VGTTISTRGCKIRLGIQRLETGKLKVLQGYIDADHAWDLAQQIFTVGYVFTIAECVVS